MWHETKAFALIDELNLNSNTKIIIKNKHYLMTSQLHRLCFVADTFSQGTKKHHKRCSCDVIKGHSYVVMTLHTSFKVPNVIQ